jgi:hypothetical protein
MVIFGLRCREEMRPLCQPRIVKAIYLMAVCSIGRVVGNTLLPPADGAKIVVFIETAGVVMVAAVGVVEALDRISRSWYGPGKLLAIPSRFAAGIVFIETCREEMLSAPVVVQTPYLGSFCGIYLARSLQYHQKSKHQSACKLDPDCCSAISFMSPCHFSSLEQDLSSHSPTIQKNR